MIKIYWNSFTYSWNLCQISPVYLCIMSSEWFDIFLHFSFAMLKIFENIILIIPLSFFLKRILGFAFLNEAYFPGAWRTLGVIIHTWPFLLSRNSSAFILTLIHQNLIWMMLLVSFLFKKQTRSFGLAFKYLHVSQPIDGKLLNIIISFKTGVYKYFGPFS